jgi:predicted alpha/beta superfamily hydrolase
MKKIYIALLTTLYFSIITLCNAQITNNKVVIGTVDSIYSKILNENRRIWVYVPAMTNPGPFGIQHYPVVYLLDGEAHFFSVVGMIQQLSHVNGNTNCPEMIVVGIQNTDRMRDLTPTHVDAEQNGDSSFANTSGGGEKFIAFIEKELIPYIDVNYPTAPYRTFIGHSLGGLTVINALLNHTNLFNSYIAIDPSLWWNEQKLLKESLSTLSKKRYDNKSLFFAVANTLSPSKDSSEVRKDMDPTSLHIRSNFQFGDVLKSAVNSGLHWQWKYYEEDDHASVPFIAEYDAFRFIFKDYKLNIFAKLNDSTFNADSAIVEHFKNLSKQMGYDILPPEMLINNLGYFYLREKSTDKAYRFFEMNIRNYPKSMNVFDSMGDYYVAGGNKQKAIEYYTKALSMGGSEQTKHKLKELEIAN